MATAQTILDYVQDQINDTGGKLISSTRLLGLMEIANKDLPPTYKDYAEAAITCVAGTGSYAIDTLDGANTCRLVKGVVLDNEPLEYTSKQKLLEWGYDLTDQGKPEYFYLDGGNLKFYPVPSSAYTGTMDYYKHRTAITATSTSIELPEGGWIAIAYYCLGQFYLKNARRPVVAQGWLDLYEEYKRDTAMFPLHMPAWDGAITQVQGTWE
jgi:hypothetical protein